MSILFLMIPLALGLAAIAVWAFLWAVDHDQFDDLDRAAHSILFDEPPLRNDDPPPGHDDEAAAGDEGPRATR